MKTANAITATMSTMVAEIKIQLDKMNPSRLRKQMRFAAARALTDSAFAAREALIRETRDKLVVRNKWTERGFKVVRAKKTLLVARIGSDRDYLVDHVTGGHRRDRAIPTKAIRKRPEQRVGRRRWPSRLIAKDSRHFIVGKGSHLVSKDGRRLVFRRMKGRRGRARLKLLYTIPQRTRIPQRIAWRDTVMDAHRKGYSIAFQRRLLEALATAR